MTGALSSYPFILALMAAALAELSSILIRRVATTLGTWLYRVSGMLAAVAAGCLIWSFTWAMSSPPVSPWGNLLTEVLGAILLLAGGGLLLWSLVTLGVQSLVADERSGLVSHGPYRWIRRPMGVAVGLLGIGGALVNGNPAMWIWFFGWLILSQPLFELEEWELLTRLSEAEGYLRRTPRYLPRRR